MMYGWNNQSWGPGAGIVMALAMVIFWGVIVFGAISFVRTFGHYHETNSRPLADPKAILRERLARGEIDEGQYQKTLSTLRERS